MLKTVNPSYLLGDKISPLNLAFPKGGSVLLLDLREREGKKINPSLCWILKKDSSLIYGGCFLKKLTLCHNFLAAKRRNSTSALPWQPAFGSLRSPVVALHYLSSNL